ncbi:Hsp70 family protein [Microcoleus sp. MON2_D5]|uniref:Hsp70 family protein n=1 Tax=Microcoleus sp. MON2_D5 TaxID=2818833 RepID=UPI002FCFE3CC
MANWNLSIRRIVQVLKRFWNKLWGLRERLARTCTTLQKQLDDRERGKAWTTYAKALSLASQCDALSVIQIVVRFDPLFDNQVFRSTIPVGRALSILIDTTPQTTQGLNAAWRLSKRLNEQSSIRQVQQQICTKLASLGDTNALLVRLLELRNEGLLTSPELTSILKIFLEKHSFGLLDSWRDFFTQFQPADLPQIHQVYAVLRYYERASELAEAALDYRSAICYLQFVTGKNAALRMLALSQQWGDTEAIALAHQKVAESFWEEGNHAEALLHFQKADNPEGISNCYQQLGQFDLAIQHCPVVSSDWIRSIREAIDNAVRFHLERLEFLSAVRLLKAVGDAWRSKSQDSTIQAEANRTQHFLSEVVRTARSAFEAELRASEGLSATSIFKQRSLLEEAAGNYLEAGLQAQKAQDYFAASLLFEKASAFGQALSALEAAEPDAPNPIKKAQLLEQGGDFFMAGLLYEGLGETEQAIAMYEQATEFWRAAQLRRQQLGDEQVIFDDRFQELLTKAGRVEQLAELCAAKASDPQRATDEKARLWRRIRDLGERNLVEQKWLDIVAIELPGIEVLDRRRFEDQAFAWVQAASREVLADYIDAIGLDLGTSNSVVCVYNKRTCEPEVVEWQGRRQIPSVFAIDQQGRELIGLSILELLGKSPRAIITKAKREMGTERKFRAGGQDYRPEEIAARIINHTRELAREHLYKKIGEKVSARAIRVMGQAPPSDWVKEFLRKHPPSIPLANVAITVPAYFNDAQKQATRTAGILANVNIIRLIHEPTAACLAQGIRQQRENETILVADLGAGTFDLSIIEVDQNVFEVLAIEGDNTLGSADLDELLYAHFIGVIAAETGQEVYSNSQAATRLRQACEELKIELSACHSWTIDLPQLVGDRNVELTLTRAELERLASSWLERIQAACQKITHKPDRILLIGGGAIMPAVHRCIQSVFKLTPGSDVDPLTAVARGAVLQAAILMDALPGWLLLDAVPFSLGIKCQTEPGQFKFDSVITKHTTIPTDKTQRYTTIEDNQTQVRIEVFQGESPIPEENFKIGQFILQGIPLAEAGVPQIDVTFKIDANCLLTVTARDAATGNQQSITIADSHLLTPAQTASLQGRFRDSQLYQTMLGRLEKLVAELTVILREAEQTDILGLSVRLQERLRSYERYREQYLPTDRDNEVFFEVYRGRSEAEMKVRLALDQWGTLSRSIQTWLQSYSSFNWRSTELENQVQQLVDEGDRLFLRARDAMLNITEISATYHKWLSTIENLSINPEGDAEALAQYFISLNRYSEALAQFQRINAPLSLPQLELKLEILARSRQHQAYAALLLDRAEELKVHSPDFENLNRAVSIYASSFVWIQVNLGGLVASGSGFAIGYSQVATNRHVLIDRVTGKCVAPEAICVVTKEGSCQVAAIHLPTWGADDVAILDLVSEHSPLVPLRLGFSELVEVGERIMTVGFPSPESGGFEENLYCNTGLVNRIRQNQFCTERVLEVSIQLQGGISGAPLLNRLGEVIGLLTFWTERRPDPKSGQFYSEQSFYAIPVEILRRLSTSIRQRLNN